MSTDYTGYVLRIPGGSSFAGFLPRYAQRSNYVTAMATVSQVPQVSFDPGALYVPRLVTDPAYMTCFMNTYQSIYPAIPTLTYSDCHSGTLTYPTAGGYSAPATGLVIPNSCIGPGAAEMVSNQWNQGVAVPTSTTGSQTFRRCFLQATGPLVPGTLLAGNQWYCDATWSSIPMHWSALEAGSSATIVSALYLMDYHGGYFVPPSAVTSLATLDTTSLTAPSSSYSTGYSIASGSCHVALGTSLPTQFIIGFGSHYSACSFNAIAFSANQVATTYFGLSSGTLYISEISASITQSP